jgi:CheY-like chemotaxis protein
MKPIHILLAEDDSIAAWITQEALKNGSFPYTLHLVSDGEAALSYLLKTGEFSLVPTPDLVILDLNMPKKDGLEVLNEMRLEPGLQKTPVIILTSSSAERDIEQTFQAHASCYISKPFNESQLVKAIDIVKQSWITSPTNS